MKVKQIEGLYIPPDSIVKLTTMGPISEILYIKHKNKNCNIRKLNSKEYMLLDTGEIKSFKAINKRTDDMTSLKKSMRKLRQLINTNILDPKKCLWCTLTYKENMQDTKTIYEDFKNFRKRLNYYLEKNNISKPEYISIAEPQERGAWHYHCIFKFKENKPYIANKKLAALWQKGFVNVKRLKDIDNVGAYLTAYLCDVELTKSNQKKYKDNKIEIKEITDSKGNKTSKKIIKGARLHMYPPKFNLYRRSKGIKNPRSELISHKDALKKVSSHKLTFQKTIELTDKEKNFNQTINYKNYNKKR